MKMKSEPCVYAVFLLVVVYETLASNVEISQQPKLFVDEGVLQIESAMDRNITFRLTAVSTLLVNDVDVLEELRQQLADIEKQEHRAPITIDQLKGQFKIVSRDLLRLTRQFNITKNNRFWRRGNNGRRIILRDTNRLRRLNATLATLEENLLLDECSSDPCKNGGTCYDGYKSFHCECAAGWEGSTCESDVNECLTLTGTDLGGCMNNGQCINTPGSYRCVCRNGYTGAHCRLKRAVCATASSSELCGHGTCVAANNEQGYVCICEQGWTKLNNTAACEIDVDECEATRNPCHDTCINLPGSFKCGPCPKGYTGDGKYCRDIDECTVNNGGCSQRPLVRCINTEGSYHCGSCPIGWMGNGHSCVPKNINSCDSERICHPLAKCEYISETVVCTCPVGLYGHGYGENGCGQNNSIDACTDHKCKNNGTCVPHGRGTSCICQAGFTGPLCAEGNACHSNPCQNGGSCKLLPHNKYKCICGRGYTGTNCENLRSYCGASIFREQGNLQFPPNNGEYEPEERCAFLIHTSVNKILNVTFNNFELEDSADCTKDFLQIHDGKSIAAHMIGRFCGHRIPLGTGNILSTHQQLFFWFRSDNATQERGFNISWISQPHICGEELNLELNAVGVIRAPGYPGKTPPYRDCEWELNAPYGSRFVLRFYEIILGSNGNCSKDILFVNDSDSKLFTACKSIQPPPIHSSSNEITLYYHTDGYRSDSTFQLHYEVVAGVPNCGGVYTEPRGQIIGYVNAPVCLYLIRQPKGTQIKIDFTKIQFLQSEECVLQKLEVFEGATAEDALLKRFCGPRDSVESIVSKGNEVLLRYEYALHGLNLNKNFEIQYSRVCRIEISVDQDGGVITTPNYPQPYFEHMTCIYKLTGRLDTIIRLNITDLSLSESLPKHDDENETIQTSAAVNEVNFLDVYLGNDVKRRYYQSLPSLSLVTAKNQATLVFHAAENKLRRRGMRVEYSLVEFSVCGGILNQDKFAIHKYFRNDCEWIIEVAEDKKIKLSIDIFSLYTTSEIVEIYDNSTHANGILLDRMNSNFVKTYDTNFLTIRYLTANLSLSYVSLEYEAVNASESCGGSFTTSYGIIKSPNWPKRYNPAQDCIWIINVPMNHQIELSVKNFSVETTAEHCSDDYLEVRNGDMPLSPLIGRYCGTRIPPRIPSFGNRLYLQFHSDAYIEDDGFYLTWQQTATGCGGKLTSYSGSIHSPHNLDGNLGATACSWQIIVAQGSTIQLDLNALDKDVCNGHLSIYDGSNKQSRLLLLDCAATKQTLQTTSHQALIRYNVDPHDPAGLRFQLDYQTNCNVIIDKLQGVIESPNFPENYPPNMNCIWDIRGGRNNHIELAFSHLDVESRKPYDCEYDYVEIHDMRNEELLNKRHLCTNSEPILSEGNRMLVQFVSDNSGHEIGFRAEYKRRGCGELMHANSGQLASPNAPYSVDLDCEWFIEAPFGMQIALEIPELHIEDTSKDCNNNVFFVAETKNQSLALLKSCQVESMPLRVTSPANTLYVHFRSDDTRSRKYFKASYYFIEASCGGTLRGSAGTIMTPNFVDYGYARNIECAWHIQVPNSYGINLDFKEFNITESENCQNSYVELVKLANNGEKHFLEKACGSIQPLIRTVLGSSLSVKFKADNNGWGRFLMKYKKECGGILNADSGFIRSHLGEDCIWALNVAEGLKISLDIQNLECQCVNNTNCYSELKLLDDRTDVILYDICAEKLSNVIAPTNNLRIVAKNINFLAMYKSAQNSCGGKITSISGVLTSPYFPSSYPFNVECVWQLETVAGSAIELYIDELDIAQTDNCNVDFLEIRRSELGSILGLYCGHVIPTEPLIAKDGLWLKFRSGDASTGRGFKLHWNYAHLIEINDASGIIESPPVLPASLDDEPYSWRILVANGKILNLLFKEYTSGLLLYDGYDETGLPVDINYSPWTFASSSNVLYLKTVNQDLSAFKILWSTASKDANSIDLTNCRYNFTLNFNQRKLITSEGYPNGYADNLKCVWVFKPAEATQHIIVDIYDVRLEVQQNCWADYLRFSTSSDLLNWNEEAKLCDSKSSNMLPFRSVAGTPYLKIDFITDGTTNRTGFKVMVRTACGSNMTDSVGMISDSLITQPTSKNSSCVWHIKVHPGRKIDFTIDYNGKELNEHEECYHYGLIYDGLDDHAPLLQPGKICNKKGFNQRSFKSRGNEVTIKYAIPTIFRNPRNNMWNLTYREHNDCESEIRLTHYARTVNISSPNYPHIPHPYTACSWTVIAPPGETISATFVDRFDMTQRYCDLEFVELYDGSTNLARLLQRTCRKLSSTLRSTSNILHVRYQTDVSEPRMGFRLNVSINSCGGEYTANAGTISSENYPVLGAYPKPALCEYSIKLPANSGIRLNFTELHLPYDARSENSSDHIEILNMDNMETILVLYGNQTAVPQFTVDSNQILIRFSTYYTLKSNYRGFQLKYSRVLSNCHRTIKGNSGEIVVNLSQITHWRSECHWRITVPKGQRVRIQFTDLKRTTSNTTQSQSSVTRFIPQLLRREHFYFFNDDFTKSLITSFHLNTFNSSRLIESSDNFMHVKILFDEELFHLQKIIAQYSSESESPCPPDIGDSEGGLIDAKALLTLNTFSCTIKFTTKLIETISFNVNYVTAVSTYNNDNEVTFRDDKLFEAFKVLQNQNMTNGLISLSSEYGRISLIQRQGGNIINFRARYNRHPCGAGLLTWEEGITLEYPKINDTHYGVLECVWTLKAKYGETGYMFLGNISLTDSCEREYISIRLGRPLSATKDLRICRDNPLINQTIFDKTLTTVTYHTEDYKSSDSSYFKLIGTKVLGTNNIKVVRIQTKSFVIDSKQYKNNMEVSWEFTSAQGVYLSILFNGRFFIEDAPNCSNDQFEVEKYQHGLWQTAAVFCGRVVPHRFETVSDHMRIVFRTNDAITGDGFSFAVATTCNATFNATLERQKISSPLFGRFWPEKLVCEYVIKTDTDKMIIVRHKNQNSPFGTGTDSCFAANFKVAKPINTERAEHDYEFEYTDDNYRERVYCGDFEVHRYKEVRIIYESIIEHEFEMEYQLSTCGGNFSQPFELRPLQGEEVDTYADNMKCQWRITAPPEHSIFLRFKYFHMEKSFDCSADFVDIFKGLFENSEERIAHICGNLAHAPPQIMIDSNQALIVATSDISGSGKGFLASVHFTPNCNERITLSDGNPQMYLQRQVKINNSEQAFCSYHATAPSSYRVKMQIKNLRLNNGRCDLLAASCANCNYLEVLDSTSADSAVLRKFCQSFQNDTMLLSANEDLTIRLFATIPGNYSFELSLSMEPTVCGQTNYELSANQSAINFTIPTENQTSYAANTRCNWLVTASEDIEVDFRRVKLPDVSQITGKCLDYIKIIYYNDESKYFCGTFNNTQMRIPIYDKMKIKILFHSDAVVEQFGGFQLTVKYLNCNHTYTELSGMIRKSNAMMKRCSYDVRVPEGYVLNLFIPFLYFTYYSDSSDKASVNFFNITDLATNRTIYNIFEYQLIEKNLFTNTNAIRIDSSGILDMELSYVASNASLPKGCGGHIFGMEARIVSPPYNDRSSLECQWDVQVPPGNGISIEFILFDMGTESNCALDKLEIYLVQANGNRQIKNTFCGQTQPESFGIPQSRVIVVSKKSPNFDGSGFTMVFKATDPKPSLITGSSFSTLNLN